MLAPADRQCQCYSVAAPSLGFVPAPFRGGCFVEQVQQPLGYYTDRYGSLVVVAPVLQNIHPFRGFGTKPSEGAATE